MEKNAAISTVAPVTSPVTPTGVNHLVLSVRDMEESHHFWSNLLGFTQVGELVKTERRPDPAKMRFYSGSKDGIAHHHDLALMAVDGLPEPGPNAGPSALGHVAITYASREDWLTQIRFLADNGVTGRRVDHGMTHSVYVQDPNGHGVEVLYELPREVWEHDVDGALNYAEVLPSDFLDDSTEYPTTFR